MKRFFWYHNVVWLWRNISSFGIKGNIKGNNMNISRRAFSLGALSFGFAPEVLWASSGASPDIPRGKPNLRLGILADTHLRTSPRNGKALDRLWCGTYFKRALMHFRDSNVDAVMHCGDFAHLGQVFELEAHARIWDEVFPPGTKSPKRLFVSGNHEFCSHSGGGNGKFVRRLYPEDEKWNEAVLQVDTAEKWKRIWNEEYEEVWHKEVLGYHFFGWQHRADIGKLATLLDECIEKYSLGKTAKPFFFVGHIPQWCPKALMRILEKRNCRNSFAFFGHNHYSSANLNTFAVKCGIFNSINVPCCVPDGRAVLLHDRKIAAAPIEGRETAEKPNSRQGLVVSVYDDSMVVERHEFGTLGKMGRDLVIPLGKYDPHPLSREELKKWDAAPEFPRRARLRIGRASVEGKGEVVTLSIPLASGNPDARAYAYDVCVRGEGLQKDISRSVYASGCNLPAGYEPNGGITSLEFPLDTLPAGKDIEFEVKPLSSLGLSGKPLSARLRL